MQITYLEEKQIKNKNLKELILEDYRFSDCDFQDCYFESCRIVNCSFVNCRFDRCTIVSLSATDSELKLASFHNCSLIGVHWGELLPATQFHQCDLRKADFRGASGYQIDPSANRMKQAKFSYPEVLNLLDSLAIEIE